MLKEAQEGIGQIKMYKDDSGYGFIIPDDGSEDIFFHVSNVNGIESTDLIAGLQVAYEAVLTPKGRNAVLIKAID
jgi:CspA family cold shock protein